jgi:hypothetical protein
MISTTQTQTTTFHAVLLETEQLPGKTGFGGAQDASFPGKTYICVTESTCMHPKHVFVTTCNVYYMYFMYMQSTCACIHVHVYVYYMFTCTQTSYMLCQSYMLCHVWFQNTYIYAMYSFMPCARMYMYTCTRTSCTLYHTWVQITYTYAMYSFYAMCPLQGRHEKIAYLCMYIKEIYTIDM